MQSAAQKIMSSLNAKRSTLVLGLGKTGYSVVEYLCARGALVTVADSRDLAPYLARVRTNYPQVEVISGGLPLHCADFPARFERIVVSPGIATTEVATAAATRTLIGDIELFVESATAPIIAITGSNGKSTVTMLVGEMLAAAGHRALIGGNIGTPALDLLAQPPADFYVLELSSFQLENTHSLRAAAAAILNISEDHMDRYRDLDGYIQAKARILNGADNIVLNRDDPSFAQLLNAHPQAISFGLDRPPGARDYGLTETAEGHEERVLCCGKTHLIAAKRMTLHGEHNIANLLAALALVESVGVVVTARMLEAALAWGGLEHRCEPVAQINGVQWINDSKGTNVGATLAALQGFASSFGKGIILIAGGIGKGADFTPLRAAVDKRVRHAVLFGRDAEHIATAIGSHTEISMARDLPHAVSLAAAIAATVAEVAAVSAQNSAIAAEPTQVVLFSPACASFDMFENYQQRGHAFKSLVAQLQVSP